jgi:hypothetical protein
LRPVPCLDPPKGLPFWRYRLFLAPTEIGP